MVKVIVAVMLKVFLRAASKAPLAAVLAMKFAQFGTEAATLPLTTVGAAVVVVVAGAAVVVALLPPALVVVVVVVVVEDEVVVVVLLELLCKSLTKKSRSSASESIAVTDVKAANARTA